MLCALTRWQYMEGLRVIKFEDSEIAQILPNCLKIKPDVKAISYAIKNAVGKVIAYSKLICVYSAIDTIPEKILDLLAVELRSQYYDDSLNVTKKRKIIKNTLLWYKTAGTPSAVQELIETVFEVGEVQEWFEYGGNPYRFKVVTNVGPEYESIIEFEKILKKVKNIRSHLDSVEFVRRQEVEIYIGIAFAETINSYIGWED